MSGKVSQLFFFFLEIFETSNQCYEKFINKNCIDFYNFSLENLSLYQRKMDYLKYRIRK